MSILSSRPALVGSSFGQFFFHKSFFDSCDKTLSDTSFFFLQLFLTGLSESYFFLTVQSSPLFPLVAFAARGMAGDF